MVLERLEPCLEGRRLRDELLPRALFGEEDAVRRARRARRARPPLQSMPEAAAVAAREQPEAVRGRGRASGLREALRLTLRLLRQPLR